MRAAGDYMVEGPCHTHVSGASKPNRGQDKQEGPDDPGPLSPDNANQVWKLKRELTLEVFFKLGPAWEAIRDARARWGIEPVSRIPPSAPDVPCPEWAPKPPRRRGEPLSEAEVDAWYGSFWFGWERELISLRTQLIPDKFRQGLDWYAFLAACVLFDPPSSDLRGFASYGTWAPYGVLPWEPPWDPDDKDRPHDPEVLSIKWMGSPEETEDTQKRFWGSIVEEIGERYLKPQGLDVWTIVHEILEDTPRILNERSDGWLRNRPRPYIEVGEDTTKEHVVHAFQAIAATHKSRPVTGRGRRDPLIAVEASLLHEERGWTYERLAERYGWNDPTRASKFIKRGREIRADVVG